MSETRVRSEESGVKRNPYRSKSTSATRFDYTRNMSNGSGGPHPNLSHAMMFEPTTFHQQSLFYQSHHKKYMFSKPKVGGGADRVYSYYEDEKNWNKDHYLKVSQEADHKGL